MKPQNEKGAIKHNAAKTSAENIDKTPKVDGMIKNRKKGEKRLFVQFAALLALNPFLINFYKGTIYQGRLKGVCIPVLNCYSCPAAATSCPLGTIQSMAAGQVSRISFYVFGILLAAAAVAGRWFCGWLCPFGLLQELLGRLSKVKAKVPYLARYIKYILLPLLVVLPIIWVDSGGFGSPYFCKYLCPQGTLSAGIPLLLADSSLRQMVGTIFWFKIVSLGAILTASVFVSRPFCRIFCPLGAFLGLFNGSAYFSLSCDETQCNSCGRCEKVCPVDLTLPAELNSPECVRCMACVRDCPTLLISFTGKKG